MLFVTRLLVRQRMKVGPGSQHWRNQVVARGGAERGE